MAKRLSPQSSSIDIFSNERLTAAMTAATAPDIEEEAPVKEPKAKAPTPIPVREAMPEAKAAVPAPTPVGKKVVEPQQDANSAVEDSSSEEAPAASLEQNVGLKFRVPQSLRSHFMSFKAEFSAALGGIALDDSNPGSVPLLERFLVNERERILEVAKQYRGELTRPTNRDPVAMAEFDHLLGEIFQKAGRVRKRKTASTNGE